MHKCRAREIDGTAGTLQVGGSGSWAYLERIVIGTIAASAVVKVYEGVDATGTKVAELDAATAAKAGGYDFGAYFKNGFYVTVTGGAAKVTVVYE